MARDEAIFELLPNYITSDLWPDNEIKLLIIEKMCNLIWN